MSEYKEKAMKALGLDESDIKDWKEYPGNKLVFVTHQGKKKEVKISDLQVTVKESVPEPVQPEIKPVTAEAKAETAADAEVEKADSKAKSKKK